MKSISKGLFKVVCNNPDGSIAWEESFSNGTTDQGRTLGLNNIFTGSTQSPSWFIGLISATSFSALSTLDTAATHSGWIEATEYNETTRRQWNPGAPVSSAGTTTMTSSAALVFTASASVSIKGAFIATASAKNSTSGVLWATGTFVSDQNLITGQTISITYQTSLT
jgi:hypothetical protein